MFLISCAKENSLPPYGDPILDTLFSETEQNYFTYDKFQSIVNNIIKYNHPQKMNALYHYINLSPKGTGRVLAYLIEERDSNVVSLINQHASKLADGDWGFISRTLVKKRWKLQEFHKIMLPAMVDAAKRKETMIARVLESYFYKYMLYEEIDKFWNLRNSLHPELLEIIETVEYASALQYKSEKTDQRVQMIFNDPPFENKRKFVLFIYAINKNKRYDFIPDILKLKASISHETHPLFIEAANEIIKEIDEALPILKKAKAENRPLGKPLDWGMDK